jgi:cell division protein FtsN
MPSSTALRRIAAISLFRHGQRDDPGRGPRDRRHGLAQPRGPDRLPQRGVDGQDWAFRPTHEDGKKPVLRREARWNVIAAQTDGRHAPIAAARLDGDEAARAAMYAGDSFRQLGQSQQADESYQNARRLVVSDSDLRVMIGDRIAGKAATPRPSTATAAKGAPPRTTMLTVQLGAFSSLETAQKEAQKVATRANVRIVPILSGGKRLYAVRVGQFSNRDAAETIRKQIGGKAVVTVASGE